MQRSLLQGEERDARTVSGHRPIRVAIREVQAILAAKQEHLETLADALIEENIAPKPASDQLEPISEKSALTTEEHILQNHREVQESISDDLLVMARNLRKTQEAFGRAVVADNELIDNTGEALYKNSESMKRTGGKLSQYTRQSSWSCWYTLITVVVALVAFMMTYVLILVT